MKQFISMLRETVQKTVRFLAVLAASVKAFVPKKGASEACRTAWVAGDIAWLLKYWDKI
jgi:hypothetical protein